MAKSKPVMNINDLTPDARNANKGTVRGRGMVEASLREVGAGRSIVVDKEGRVIAGNKTLEAAADIGLEIQVVHTNGERLVVVQRDDLDLSDDTGPARKLAYLDNRASDVGLAWDAEQLLADLNAGFSFNGVFDTEELDALLAGLVAPEPVNDTPPDVSKADELQKKWQTSLGQMWQLGAHRLICGDCTDKATVARLMGGEKADMMWTDPPYGVDYVGKTKNALTIENDGADDLVGLLDASFSVADEILSPGAVYYIAHPDIFAYEFIGAIRKRKWVQARPPVVLWVKDSFVMGRGDYHSRSESLLYGWKAGAAHHAVTDRTQDNVWEIPRPKASEEHPTMKPVELVCRSLRNSTSTHDIVYEPFSGSGTTLIACEQLSRQCRAIELDHGYCAITLQRFQDATGIEPILLD